MRGLCAVFLRGGAGKRVWVCLVGGGVSERLEREYKSTTYHWCCCLCI